MDKKEKNPSDDILETLLKTGSAAYRELMQSSATLPIVESMVLDNFMESGMDEQEIIERYRGILEAMSIGQLIGAMIAMSEKPREALLSLANDDRIHHAMIKMFKDWDISMDDDSVAECLVETINAAMDDGMIEDEEGPGVLMN